MNQILRFKVTCALLAILVLFSSCAGGAQTRTDAMRGPLTVDVVVITRAATSRIDTYGAKGANPYVARSSILFKSDLAAFYVYELTLPPSTSIHFALLSGTLLDASGAQVGTLLTIDELRAYWAKYLIPDADKQEIESVIERTYLGRFDFNYSSNRGRSYVLVFKGDAPARSNLAATFSIRVDGQERLIEVK